IAAGGDQRARPRGHRALHLFPVLTAMPPSRSVRAPLVTDAIPPALRRRGITARQLLATCLARPLGVAAFASRDTPGWAGRLGDTALDHSVRGVAGAWDRAMEDLGFTRPHDRLRDAMQRWLGAGW